MSFHPLPHHRITSRDKTLDLSQPVIMGILNITPDSFSDGGEHMAVQQALQHCQLMLEQGAGMIDIGGESTRPNAQPVSEQEELDRVVPVVESIRQHFGDEVWLSIDTSNPQVMKEAYHAGADIWNDVRALKKEGALAMAAQLNIPVVLMHMRGDPDSMNEMACYQNVIQEVFDELQQRVEVAVQAGIDKKNIILDMGFGFAKNYPHHQALLTHLSEFQKFDLPILFGISRKRFLGEVLNHSQIPAFHHHHVKERDAVGMAAALLAVQQGASIIRTHNVAMTAQGLSLWKQLVACL